MEQIEPLRASLARQDVVTGARVATFSPSLVEVYGELGLDFAWLDFEHAGPSPSDTDVLGHLVRAAATANIDPMVRLPSGEPSLIRRTLDTGVRTILVPRVRDATAVRRAVRAARFDYAGEVGDRGIGGSRASGWGAELSESVSREDETVLVGIMIENRDAVENIEEILAVPHLGFVFVGPADLSVSLERPMETDHPKVRSAVATVREAATAAGVPVGYIANEPAEIRQAVENSYRILRIGGEFGAVRETLGRRLAAVEDS